MTQNKHNEQSETGLGRAVRVLAGIVASISLLLTLIAMVNIPQLFKHLSQQSNYRQKGITRLDKSFENYHTEMAKVSGVIIVNGCFAAITAVACLKLATNNSN